MGLLDNALQALKSQYEETKGNVGLLVSDPKRYMSGLNQDAAEYNRLSSLALQAERNAYRGIPVSQEQAAAKQYIDQQQQDMALAFAAPIVYHGSPRVFDKFDLSKVGTGQKNQAQGYGIYVSESKPYAETFARENLTGAPNVAYRSQLGGNDPLDVLKKLYPDKSNEWYSEQITKGNVKGNLYTADLPDKYLNKMIDYDSEIKNQSQSVKNVAKKLNLSENDLGIDIINKVGRTKEGSDFLAKEGLSGVKYVFDDNKFKATNYVVFDPETLKMLNKGKTK